MIFVTVGTHEQPFNRLLKAIDEGVYSGTITEEVFAQTGYSTYIPKNYKAEAFLDFSKMQELIERASIIVSHGGPSSFIMPLQIGKIPIVFPRQEKFKEHVNNHQLTFCREVLLRNKNIILAEDSNELIYDITHYQSIVNNMKISINSNNAKFNDALSRMIDKMFNN